MHGFAGSYEGTWGGDSGVYPRILTESGFRVVGVDMGGFPDNILPVSFALNKFRLALEEDCHQLGIQSYDMIGHSMGGLVGRSYATKSYGWNRINRLVTMGTPHHGANIANSFARGGLVRDHFWATYICVVSNFWYCPDPDDLPALTALRDLRIGSQFLNSLNYDDDQSSIFFNPCRSSFDETTNHHDTTVYSIAGTEPGGNFRFALPYIGCRAPSDGVVLKNRAYYHDGYTCTDVGLGGEGSHHKDGPVGLARSELLAEEVLELLVSGEFDCTERSDADEVEGHIPSYLPRIEATVQPGETYTETTLVNGINLASFQCVATADSLVYTLESPSGRIIDPDECALDPDLGYTRDLYAASYAIQNPEAGLWTHRVSCIDSVEPDDLTIFTTFDGAVVLAAETQTGIDPDDAFTLHAAFTDAGYPMPSGTVTATVTSPGGTVDEVDLYDDGTGDDETPGDGIYSASYPAGGETGTFGFVFRGDTDPDDPQSEVREYLHVATADWLPDPAIDAPGLVVEETEVPYGGLVDLSASFTNLGTATADSVLISLTNLTYGTALAETLLVGMSPGQTISLQTEWLAMAEGDFALRAGIDLIGDQVESNLSNNGSEVVVTVTIPDDVTSVSDDGAGDGSGGGPAAETSRVLLYPNFPNPLATGSTRIRFQVPQAGAQTELAVFDVRGRRVRTIVSEVLPRGEHARLWDGSDQSGRQVASGVYFYRLQVADEVQIKKMVVVR
jgi:pimeloyl-ACP methyl ester carboxylesterase